MASSGPPKQRVPESQVSGTRAKTRNPDMFLTQHHKPPVSGLLMWGS